MVTAHAAALKDSEVERMQHLAHIVLHVQSIGDDAQLVKLSTEPRTCCGLMRIAKFSAPGLMRLPVTEPMMLMVRASLHPPWVALCGACTSCKRCRVGQHLQKRACGNPGNACGPGLHSAQPRAHPALIQWICHAGYASSGQRCSVSITHLKCASHVVVRSQIRHRRTRLGFTPIEIDPDAELAATDAEAQLGASAVSLLCAKPSGADHLDF